MKQVLLVCMIVLCGVGRLQAQTVQVFSASTQKPVALVAITINVSDKAAITDKEGKANIGGFIQFGTFNFRHPSYQTFNSTFDELKANNFIVFLEDYVRQMPEFTVSANKWEQKTEEIPNQIVALQPQTIALSNPATTADALGLSGQVFVQKSQLGGGSPIIRGFAANSVLIVVDGVRMNNAIYRSGNLQNVISLDANSLQEAEVVFGPGSVIYGSDALGGVMDFHTRLPDFSEEPQFSGEGMVRFGTAANETTGHLNFSYSTPRFATFTSISHNRFDDLRTGDNRTDDFPDFGKRLQYVQRINGEDVIVDNPDFNVQTGSGYNQTNALQKFHWRLGSAADITYSAHFSTSSDIPRYDRLIQRNQNNELSFAEWYYGPQEWQMHHIQSRLYYPTRWFDQVKITGAIQFVEESRHDRRFGNNTLRSRTEKVDIASINFDFEKTLSEGNELYYGIELVNNQVESTAIATDIVTNQQSAASTRYPDGGSDFTSGAIYLSTKRKLSPKFFLSSGIRYTFVRLESRFEDRSFFNFPFDEIKLNNGALSGSLGLVHLPNDRWKFNVLASSGFRSPNIDDIGKVFDSEPGNVIVPNPDLQPEFSYNFEYGIRRNFGEGFYLEFVNYYSFLRDALVRRNFTFNGQPQIIYDGVLSQVQAEVNAGRAFIWGASVQGKLNLGRNTTLSTSLTFTEGEDTIDNLPLRHVVPLFGQTAIDWQFNKLKLQVVTRYSGGIDFEDLAPSEQNKPHFYTTDGALSWAILNINANYELNSRLKLGINLENLLDTHYRPYSSGISAPGFNALLSVRMSF